MGRIDPKPKTIQYNLTFTTANGSEFNLTIPINISVAQPKVTKTKVSEDKKSLSVYVKNVGNQPLETVEVNLSRPFQADLQQLSSLKAGETKRLSFALPKEFEHNLTISFVLPNRAEISSNPTETKIAPLYEWKSSGIKITTNKVLWYIYALIVVTILILLWLIRYYQRYKNPLVIKLTQNPDEIWHLNLAQLKEAKNRLKKIGRWSDILELAKLKDSDTDRVFEFFDGDDHLKAEIFAKQLDARYESDGVFYRVILGNDFELEKFKSFLLLITDKPVAELEELAKSIPDKLFIISKNAKQDEIADIARDKTNSIVAPTSQELIELLLSPNAQKVLIKILADTFHPKDISPYQINGDIKSEKNFFGRIDILKDIIANSDRNYIIVGSRQLGKSSLLRALERRYSKSSGFECYYITLDESGDLLNPLGECLGLDGGDIEQIKKQIKSSREKIVFLIDEADMFVKNERENGYLITSAFRKLSQEGDAIFILAGFWTLYEYAILDYQSPLKNFGKIITLGGLEHQACRELMIEPMKSIDIGYESDEVIESVIGQCGERANYIATLCDIALEKLGDGKLITTQDIERVKDDNRVHNMLQGWGNLTVNKEQNRVDRIIIYLTIDQESFRLKDIIEALSSRGVKIDITMLEQSLDRLVIGYILTRSKGNYSYIIPLMVEKLREDDVDIKLDEELIGIRED